MAEGTFVIPMPFFDSKSHPSAIAIPFKKYTLRNIESKSSAYILLKFYVAASKCMTAKDVDKVSWNTFQSNFYAFLDRKVLPHLRDDRFYAAFGGVLRIISTLKGLGVSPASESEYNAGVRKIGFAMMKNKGEMSAAIGKGNAGAQVTIDLKCKLLVNSNNINFAYCRT